MASGPGATDATSGAPANSASSGGCEGECVPAATPLDEGDGAGAIGSTDAGAENVPGARADAGGASRPNCAAGAVLGPGGRCFLLNGAGSSWAAARSDCQDRGEGWDLATVRDLERNAWLAALMLLENAADAWVGASDTSSEGTWRWIDDAAPFWNGTGTAGDSIGDAYENWNDGSTPEPNGGDASDCMRLRADGGWADFQCPTAFASICEGPRL